MTTVSEESGQLIHSILTTRPEVEAVTGIESFRPTYRPFPARVTVKLKQGEFKTEVLKTSKERDALSFERDVLQALRELGLPVPQVLSSVFEFPAEGATHWGVFLQELEGHPLAWLGLNDLPAADRTCVLTIEAVGRLQSLTERILEHPIASILPRRTMVDELNTIKNNTHAWSEDSFFRDALETIESMLPQVTVPLTFSNGDYNPLNILADNDGIVGFVDFEHACFEDPHIGFAKFLLWADDAFGWATGARSGLVERYLFQNNVRPRDFYCRVVLRGLYFIHLRPPENPPQYMIDVVSNYTGKLKGGRRGQR